METVLFVELAIFLRLTRGLLSCQNVLGDSVFGDRCLNQAIRWVTGLLRFFVCK